MVRQGEGSAHLRVRVLSIDLSFSVLPHPEVPEIVQRNLAAQCKCF